MRARYVGVNKIIYLSKKLLGDSEGQVGLSHLITSPCRNTQSNQVI